MSPSNSRSILNSLKGRIWLAVSALATVNCILGLGVYFVFSYVAGGGFLPAVASVFALTFLTLVFGWWLANDVLRPVESVTLLAKSLERSPSASLPRTTGSSETDELLHSLHRSGQQLQNLISLMDDVAAGKTEAATMPLESADKLSIAFQKLVGRVTDSITAKRDLDELQKSLSTISNQASGVRNGKLDVSIRTEVPQTKEIADTLRYLTNRLNNLAQQVHASAAECARTANEVRSSLRSVLDSYDERAALIGTVGNHGGAAVRSESLVSEFSKLINDAIAHYEEFAERQSSQAGAVETTESLKTQLGDASKKVRKLRDRTAELTILGRSAQELTRRSNLVALNSSIPGNGSEVSRTVITGEIESLSKRSEALLKGLASLGEGLNGEIADLEIELGSLQNSLPAISKSVAASIETNYELGTLLTRLTDMEERLRITAEETNAESARMAATLKKLSDASVATALVRSSEASLQKVSGVMEGLKDSIVDIAPFAPPAPTNTADLYPQTPPVTGYETVIERPADTAGENQ